MGNCEKAVTFNVNLCGCHSDCSCGCGEIQPPEQKPEEKPEEGCTCNQASVVEITVGEGGDFKTLREALEYVKTVVCNTARITLVSNVKETGESRLHIDRYAGHPPIVIDGNDYTLDLSSITDKHGISMVHTRVRLRNITIAASNTKVSIITVAYCADLHFNNYVTLIGGGSSKLQRGVYIFHNAHFLSSERNSEIRACATGVYANFNGQAVIDYPITFTDVTTQFSPAKNTVGNHNSCINTNIESV